MVNDLPENFKISDFDVFHNYSYFFASRNSRLLNFAKDELSDHDSKNCSDIRRVTWFIIGPKILTFLTLMFFTPPYYTGGGVVEVQYILEDKVEA